MAGEVDRGLVQIGIFAAELTALIRQSGDPDELTAFRVVEWLVLTSAEAGVTIVPDWALREALEALRKLNPEGEATRLFESLPIGKIG